MNRDKNINKIATEKEWDLIVIGGGASGLGVAVDACSRNLKVLLIEEFDFSKGTSSRSTKLVHGGVRYLKNGELSLVIEALKERGIMLNNAPHLVRNMSFIIPTYDWWDTPFYGIGLKVYDLMAGKLGLGPSQFLSKKETIEKIPNVNQDELNGGIIYHDGQFDDARMGISLAHTVEEHGGAVVNYLKWDSFIYENGQVSGIKVTDQITQSSYALKAKVVVNATGVFAEKIMRADEPKAELKIKPSQGVHLVLDKSFLKSENAIMVPNTSDGRVLFAVPWHDVVVVGTTDTEVNNISIEPKASDQEIDFILSNAEKYMTRKPKRSDVKSVFAGLRPLISKENKSSKSLSRKHTIYKSKKGVYHLLGGKWTTYRKMGRDVLELIASTGQLKFEPSKTEELRIFGYKSNVSWSDPLHFYGSEKEHVMSMGSNKPLSPLLPLTEAQIIYAIRYEMALNLEDVLSRRTRCLLLNAKECILIAPEVARIMRSELNAEENWEQEQIKLFLDLAKNYHL
jgi:glycerol-3-phosphate dehydrogenase